MDGTYSDMLKVIRFLCSKYLTGYGVPEQPHFDPLSTPAFEELLGRARCYLEFGSGGSTLAAARRGVDTLSVDSDRHFAEAVRRRLPPGACCRILDVDIGLTGAWGVPVFKRQTPLRRRRWRRYVDLPFETLAQQPARIPDLVLIDGRFRRACALESARQARHAGKSIILFFDDYADRPYYHEVERHLGPPRMSGRAAIFQIGEGPQIAASLVAEAAADYR